MNRLNVAIWICVVVFISSGRAPVANAQSVSPTAQSDGSRSSLDVGDAPLVGPASGNLSNSNTDNSDSKRLIAGQCANLLKMATDLQQEVSHQTQLTISAAALRNADEIEKLSKAVTGRPRQKTKH